MLGIDAKGEVERRGEIGRGDGVVHGRVGLGVGAAGDEAARNARTVSP